jgi:transcriptional regulator with XRE-family HTH domain
MNFGEKLREARNAAKMTQNQLARLIGLAGKQAISNWEHNISQPNFETLELLARHLNVSINSFFGLPSGDEEVFIGANGKGVLLPAGDPLRESFHEAQEQFESGELGAKVTVQMVVDAALDRETFFKSHPYMAPFWTLMYKLATEHYDVSILLADAKLTNEQVAIIADAIRVAVPKKP